MRPGRNLFFIVAYNHENFIEAVVRRFPSELLADSGNELLIIDDGSTDRTFHVSDALRAELRCAAKVTVLKNKKNQGYGGNQKLGYRYAIDHGFDRVFLIHGDGQYPPELLGGLIAEYGRDPAPDAVFGTRMADSKSPLKGGMPLYKFVGNKILTRIQNFLLKTKLSEFHSGYRSYSVRLLERIPFELNSNDFDFDTEIIIQAVLAGARIVEMPIDTHYGDEICHVNGFRYAWQVAVASFHSRLMRMGFLYDRRFDVLDQPTYPAKPSRHSSHSRIVDRVPAGSRVLDIGCGVGHVARQLTEKGCVVDGVDVLPASEVSSCLDEYFQINLNDGLPALGEILSRKPYDVIVLADVIEHVISPEGLLDTIRENCSGEEQPTVLISTPNVAFFIVRAMLALGEFNYGPRGILDRTHVRLFTKRSFRKLLAQCNYELAGRAHLPMPVTSVLGSGSKAGLFAESVNRALAALLPGLFAYQFLYEARPLPTTRKLLAVTKAYSGELRTTSHDGSLAHP